jgi:hypothetical protein
MEHKLCQSVKSASSVVRKEQQFSIVKYHRMKTTTDDSDETDATADGTNLHWVIAALAAEIRNNPFNGA